MKIKFREAVVLGAGLYLGHEVMKSIDQALGKVLVKTDFYKNHVDNKIKELEPENNENSNKIVSFHV